MKYKSGYRYITMESEGRSVLLPNAWTPHVWILDGVLVITERYAWDGASFLPFKWFGTPKSWLTPSLVHDALYQLILEGLLDRQYRAAADRLFRDMLLERGVWRIVAWSGYWAVRVFGNFAVRQTNPVREAV